MSGEQSRSTQATARPMGQGQLVLVVEDNEKNARMIIAMLEAAGYSTRWAADGDEGLRMTCELQPALVMTDLQMPGLDGVSMTRALKSSTSTASIPVIAVTAHALAEHREQALAAGCVKFMTKPFRYQTLLAEVADALQPAGA
jgi:two-component system cell cycle response regulator DivK